MKITITMVVDDSLADPSDSTGITEEGYNAICERLRAVGDDIEVVAGGADG